MIFGIFIDCQLVKLLKKKRLLSRKFYNFLPSTLHDTKIELKKIYVTHDAILTESYPKVVLFSPNNR